MKNLMIGLLLLFIVSSCSEQQKPVPKPQEKAVCWRSLVSGAFPFVVSMVNVCDGSEGGTVKYVVIKPILDYINERNEKSDKILQQELSVKIRKNIF